VGTQEEVVFLLGAGVSVAAGMPSTKEITQELLTSTKLQLNSDGSVKYTEDASSSVESYQRFLRWMRYDLASLTRGGRDQDVTYEDIYYVLHAVNEALWGESVDPLATLYCKHASAKFSESQQGPSSSLCMDKRWVRKCARFVRSAVGAYLEHAQRNRTLNYCSLAVLGEVCAARDTRRVHFFSLCHDFVLERFLHCRGVPFFNGLGQASKSIRWLETEGYRKTECKVLVYKLHGSLEWARWRAEENADTLGRVGARVAKPRPTDLIFLEDGKGYHYRPPEPYSAIVVGTLNKAADYQWAPFRDLVSFFLEALERTNRVVVCGHSFGDRFIAGHLADWLRAEPDRRLVVVDPRSNELKEKLKGRVFEDRCVFVNSGIEEARLSQLKAHGE